MFAAGQYLFGNFVAVSLFGSIRLFVYVVVSAGRTGVFCVTALGAGGGDDGRLVVVRQLLRKVIFIFVAAPRTAVYGVALGVAFRLDDRLFIVVSKFGQRLYPHILAVAAGQLAFAAVRAVGLGYHLFDEQIVFGGRSVGGAVDIAVAAGGTYIFRITLLRAGGFRRHRFIFVPVGAQYQLVFAERRLTSFICKIFSAAALPVRKYAGSRAVRLDAFNEYGFVHMLLRQLVRLSGRGWRRCIFSAQSSLLLHACSASKCNCGHAGKRRYQPQFHVLYPL